MKNLILVLLISITMFSCSKSNSNGTVIFDDPALDGCGWVIRINDQTYLPINLDEQYQQDGLSVEIDYEKLNKVPCGNSINPVLYQIEIIEIK